MRTGLRFLYSCPDAECVSGSARRNVPHGPWDTSLALGMCGQACQLHGLPCGHQPVLVHANALHVWATEADGASGAALQLLPRQPLRHA